MNRACRTLTGACFPLLCVVCSCGIYSFSGSTLPPHIKTVAIPLFYSNIPEYGIDQALTDAVIEAVTKDNTLKISESGSSDSILKGSIVRVTDAAAEYNQEEKASAFRVTVTAKVSFEDVKKQKMLWEETWSQWGEYESDREEGIQEALKKISEEIVNKTVSGW